MYYVRMPIFRVLSKFSDQKICFLLSLSLANYKVVCFVRYALLLHIICTVVFPFY